MANYLSVSNQCDWAYDLPSLLPISKYEDKILCICVPVDVYNYLISTSYNSKKIKLYLNNLYKEGHLNKFYCTKISSFDEIEDMTLINYLCPRGKEIVKEHLIKK